MTIDLTNYHDWVSFEKNGNNMGIAFSGLNDWEDVYIMFSIHFAGHRFKISDYKVIEE